MFFLYQITTTHYRLVTMHHVSLVHRALSWGQWITHPLVYHNWEEWGRGWEGCGQQWVWSHQWSPILSNSSATDLNPVSNSLSNVLSFSSIHILFCTYIHTYTSIEDLITWGCTAMYLSGRTLALAVPLAQVIYPTYSAISSELPLVLHRVRQFQSVQKSD